MATVVESEEVKTDEEKAVKKVVEEENEPESAGGCDVCLPPNGLIGCSSYNYNESCCTHLRRVLMLHTFHLIPPGTIT